MQYLMAHTSRFRRTLNVVKTAKRNNYNLRAVSSESTLQCNKKLEIL